MKESRRALLRFLVIFHIIQYFILRTTTIEFANETKIINLRKISPSLGRLSIIIIIVVKKNINRTDSSSIVDRSSSTHRRPTPDDPPRGLITPRARKGRGSGWDKRN